MLLMHERRISKSKKAGQDKLPGKSGRETSDDKVLV